MTRSFHAQLICRVAQNMDTQEGSQLVLSWNDTSWTVGSGSTATAELRLGSGTDAHLQQQGTFVSRQHAYIAQRQQSFVLVDHSTNGTFVQSEDQHIANVHRDEVRLWGAGYISLGEGPNRDNVIGYQLTVSGAPR